MKNIERRVQVSYCRVLFLFLFFSLKLVLCLGFLSFVKNVSGWRALFKEGGVLRRYLRNHAIVCLHAHLFFVVGGRV